MSYKRSRAIWTGRRLSCAYRR